MEAISISILQDEIKQTKLCWHDTYLTSSACEIQRPVQTQNPTSYISIKFVRNSFFETTSTATHHLTKLGGLNDQKNR